MLELCPNWARSVNSHDDWTLVEYICVGRRNIFTSLLSQSIFVPNLYQKLTVCPIWQGKYQIFFGVFYAKIPLLKAHASAVDCRPEDATHLAGQADTRATLPLAASAVISGLQLQLEHFYYRGTLSGAAPCRALMQNHKTNYERYAKSTSCAQAAPGWQFGVWGIFLGGTWHF